MASPYQQQIPNNASLNNNSHQQPIFLASHNNAPCQHMPKDTSHNNFICQQSTAESSDGNSNNNIADSPANCNHQQYDASNNVYLQSMFNNNASPPPPLAHYSKLTSA
jgi:hypothetical protein